MRYWKCIESKREDWFTVGKIYRSEDGKVKDNDRDLRDTNAILYCDIYKFTEVAEQDYIKQEKGEDKMKDLRNLIIVGRIVKFDDGKISKVETNRWEELSFSGEHWFPVARLNSDLKYSGVKIVEIYGRCSSNEDAWKLSTDYRDLIWKRTTKSPTQIKLEELEKKQRELADEMEKLRKEM